MTAKDRKAPNGALTSILINTIRVRQELRPRATSATTDQEKTGKSSEF